MEGVVCGPGGRYNTMPDERVDIVDYIDMIKIYMLCILAPSAAFAFSANPGVAHCLTEGHVGVHDHGSKVHVHADGDELTLTIDETLEFRLRRR